MSLTEHLAGLFAAVVLSFIAGSIFYTYDLFPASFVRRGLLAMHAWHERAREKDGEEDATARAAAIREAASIAASNVPPGKLLFILRGSLDQQGHDINFAELYDETGAAIHRWTFDVEEVYAQTQFITPRPRQHTDIKFIGGHLFANGDVLISLQGMNTFPFATGMIMLDRDSRVRWFLAEPIHHWFMVHEGTIYAVASDLEPSPWQSSDGSVTIVSKKSLLYEDHVFLIDALDGTIRRRINVLEAIASSAYRDLLPERHDDPIHLNDVRVLTAAKAPLFPMFEAGDLLISMREIDAIMVLDPDDERIKWAAVGQTLRQHSPRFAPNGTILAFDNQGASVEYGRSRIVEIDPTTSRTVWEYAGSPEHTFFTKVCGEVNVASSDLYVVAETWSGDAFTVNRQTGEMAMLYRNLRLKETQQTHFPIHHANLIERSELTFLTD